MEDVMQKRLKDVLKMSCKMRNYYAEDVLKTSSRRLGKEMFAEYDLLVSTRR